MLSCSLNEQSTTIRWNNFILFWFLLGFAKARLCSAMGGHSRIICETVTCSWVAFLRFLSKSHFLLVYLTVSPPYHSGVITLCEDQMSRDCKVGSPLGFDIGKWISYFSALPRSTRHSTETMSIRNEDALQKSLVRQQSSWSYYSYFRF